MSREQSTIGASQNYGPFTGTEGLPAAVSTYGSTREVTVPFTYAQANAGLPTLNSAVDKAVLEIPANSLIKAAYLKVDTAFTSGGSATLQLGTQNSTGTAVDADGLDSLAVAALTANSWHVLDGALVGATSGTVVSQISIDDATAVFTAGSATLIVEYMPPKVAVA